MKIKTRFSPSPTGMLHAGGARTALYNWLFAKNHGGKFILRIEDTDVKRSKKKYINNIIDSMSWLNIKWDEGPYFQTERTERYQLMIKKMLNSGLAYKCFCSEKRLKILRNQQIILGKKPKYDRFCLKNKNNSNNSYVVRFRNSLTGLVSFYDKIRGLITFDNSELDDLIIQRSNGVPTYNFCVVIDDSDMKITHIIRGEEHINNTPRQINIFKAIGANVPIYAHVSTILDESGKKLSKRFESTSIMQYREDGYLPEAIINHLVRLGWSYGNQEIFSINDMQKLFDINHISKSSCVFNTKKLQWLNRFYINTLSDDIILNKLQMYLKQEKITVNKDIPLIKVINLLKKHCKTLKEMSNLCRYFYEDIKEFDLQISKKYLNTTTSKQLKIFFNKINNIGNWTLQNIENIFQEIIIELNLKKNYVCIPIRIAITGLLHSPELYKTLEMLGKKRILKKIQYAIEFINKSRKK